MISIIIPVFNAEKYIAKTLANICAQTYKNLEIICVLDKPTDKSEPEILSVKDSRIKIIKNKQNLGAAESRNVGVKYATGEWIHFMDSDDFITLDFYEKMLAVATPEIDAVASCVFYEANPKHSIWFKKNETVSGRIKMTKTEVLIHGWLWRYIIRRDFWKRSKLAFPKLSIMEDMPVMVEMVYRANKVALCKDAVYFYKDRMGSIVNRIFDDKKRLDWNRGRELMHDFMKKNGIRKPNRLIYIIKRM
jgi:glycosyltransferase involved in cell wall biosynthesis